MRQQKAADFSRLSNAQKGSGIEALLSLAETYVEVVAEWFRFTAFFVCSECGECACAIGNGRAANSKPGQAIYFQVVSCIPELPIFELKSPYPKEIRTRLQQSFAVFFQDPAAAGNRVRACIEVLLDKLGVARYRIDEKTGQVVQKKGGSAAELSLGERLKQLSAAEPDLAKMLGGVKQLGNEATHGNELAYDDLLKAYELLEHVLDDIYVTRPKRTELLQASTAMSQKYS